MREAVSELRRITVTDQNMERLNALMEKLSTGRYAAEVERLDAELAIAEVVPAHRIGPDVVTMNSKVLYEENDTGVQRVIEVVWPHEANGHLSRVSVLAPIGVALLGLSVGDSIEVTTPTGPRRLRVVRVLYQPEADIRSPPPRAA